MMNLEKKVLNLEKKLMTSKKEYNAIKDRNEYVEKVLKNYEKKYSGLFNFFEDCLEQFFNDEELVNNQEIFVNIDSIRKCDCRPEFVKAMNGAMQAGTYEGVQLAAPYTNLTKADLVRRGARLGIDYGHTYSCYRGGERHCGTCGTCTERKESFREAGVPDRQCMSNKFHFSTYKFHFSKCITLPNISKSPGTPLELDYPSKCTQLHGHNWQITIHCKARELDHNGMVVDFSKIKSSITDKLDHQVINDVIGCNPRPKILPVGVSSRWKTATVSMCRKPLGISPPTKLMSSENKRNILFASG